MNKIITIKKLTKFSSNWAVNRHTRTIRIIDIKKRGRIYPVFFLIRPVRMKRQDLVGWYHFDSCWSVSISITTACQIIGLIGWYRLGLTKSLPASHAGRITNYRPTIEMLASGLGFNSYRNRMEICLQGGISMVVSELSPLVKRSRGHHLKEWIPAGNSISTVTILNNKSGQVFTLAGFGL